MASGKWLKRFRKFVALFLNGLAERENNVNYFVVIKPVGRELGFFMIIWEFRVSDCIRYKIVRVASY